MIGVVAEVYYRIPENLKKEATRILNPYCREIVGSSALDKIKVNAAYLERKMNCRLYMFECVYIRKIIASIFVLVERGNTIRK